MKVEMKETVGGAVVRTVETLNTGTKQIVTIKQAVSAEKYAYICKGAEVLCCIIATESGLVFDSDLDDDDDDDDETPTYLMEDNRCRECRHMHVHKSTNLLEDDDTEEPCCNCVEHSELEEPRTKKVGGTNCTGCKFEFETVNTTECLECANYSKYQRKESK